MEYTIGGVDLDGVGGVVLVWWKVMDGCYIQYFLIS